MEVKEGVGGCEGREGPGKGPPSQKHAETGVARGRGGWRCLGISDRPVSCVPGPLLAAWRRYGLGLQWVDLVYMELWGGGGGGRREL